jgi:hypothetical protein
LKCLQSGQLERATRIVERETLAIFDLRAKQPGYSTSVIKEAMNLCGIGVGPVRTASAGTARSGSPTSTSHIAVSWRDELRPASSVETSFIAAIDVS